MKRKFIWVGIGVFFITIILVFIFQLMRTERLVQEVNDNSNLGIDLFTDKGDILVDELCSGGTGEASTAYYDCSVAPDDSYIYVGESEFGEVTVYYSSGYPTELNSMSKITGVYTNETGRSVFGVTVGEEIDDQELKQVFEGKGYDLVKSDGVTYQFERNSIYVWILVENGVVTRFLVSVSSITFFFIMID